MKQKFWSLCIYLLMLSFGVAGCSDSSEGVMRAPDSERSFSTEQMFKDGKALLGDEAVAVFLFMTPEDLWDTVCEIANQSAAATTDACVLDRANVLDGYSLIEKAAFLENVEALRFLVRANNMELDEAVARYRAAMDIEPSEATKIFGNSAPRRLGNYWEKLAILGDVDAKAFVGYLYSAEPLSDTVEAGGWYVDAQDLGKAKKFLREAAESDNVFAMNKLSDLLREENPIEAYDWSRSAALLGSALGADQVARAHWQGKGAIKNPVMAAAWAAIAESKGRNALSINSFLLSAAAAESYLIESGQKLKALRDYPENFNQKVDDLTVELFNKLPVGDVDGKLPSQLLAWEHKSEVIEGSGL